MESAIFLFDKEHRGCDKGFGWNDVPLVQIVLKELVQFILLVQRHRENFGSDCFGSLWLKVYAMVIGFMLRQML